MNRLHEFTLILDDSELEKVYRRYAALENFPVKGSIIEPIERDIGVIACAAVRMDLLITAKLFELEARKARKRGAE